MPACRFAGRHSPARRFVKISDDRVRKRNRENEKKFLKIPLANNVVVAPHQPIIVKHNTVYREFHDFHVSTEIMRTIQSAEGLDAKRNIIQRVGQ